MSSPRASIFDAVRKVARPGLFSDPANVLALDMVLDAFDVPRENVGDPNINDWLDLAAPLIEEFEGYAKRLPDGSVRAYPDPGTGGKPWTIGVGSTTDEQGQPIPPGTVWSRERALARFKAHLAEFGEGVDRLLAGRPVTAAQKAALVAWAYNVGLGAVARSTLLRKHKEGDYEGAADEFRQWNRAAGRVLAGLTRRREAERQLYRSGTP